MSNPIKLPPNFSEYDFKEMLKTERMPANRTRLLAMINIQEKRTLSAIADILQIHWKTIQKWLSNFRKRGIDGLFVQPKSGAPKKLNPSIERWISDLLLESNKDTSGGRITGKQIHELVQKKFDVSCSLRTIYVTLHRLNFSWITSRSIHPKSDLEVQELYKKLSNSFGKVAS